MAKPLKWHNETRLVKDLIPYNHNPRRLTPKQLEHLQESLEKFNLVEIPAIDTTNKIVAGHQRVHVLALLGRTEEEIDVRVPNRKLTEEEFREYLIRSNKNTGDWDYDVLADFGEEMLLEVGFEPAELDNIFDLEPGGKDPNEVPDLPENPETQEGDIYVLGEHRLICGDSLDPRVMRDLFLPGEIAEMVFTDPPYNVNYKGKGEETSRGIKNDKLTPEAFEEFAEAAFSTMAASMREGAPYYICSGWSSYPVFHAALNKAGFYRAGVIIWVKNNASYGWNDYRYKHEWVLVGKNKKRPKTRGASIMYGWRIGSHFFRDTRDEYDVWEVPRKDSCQYKHPTEKPVWLIEKALANSTVRYQVVLDPFAGSGSTLVACERLTRKARLCELDPAFCDVIVKRWEIFTGQKAERIRKEG